MSAIHILNGDALKQQFPTDQIPGELLVMKECLVDGNVKAHSQEEFFEVRARALHELYNTSIEEYHRKTVPQLRRMNEITGGEVVLWFEDDLFCQVNFWFVCHLLSQKSVELFLVRPEVHTQFGFGGLSQSELIEAFQNKRKLDLPEKDQVAALWNAYQQDDLQSLSRIAEEPPKTLPFVPAAVQAHLDRNLLSENPGKPERVLSEIIEEVGSEDFGEVFKEFSRREPIYGFGDLQVKRIYDRLTQK